MVSRRPRSPPPVRGLDECRETAAVGWHPAGLEPGTVPDLFPLTILRRRFSPGRWVVLSAGAVVGCIIWTKNPRRRFGALHLIAFFCVCAAFVSATVSPFIQM